MGEFYLFLEISLCPLRRAGFLTNVLEFFALSPHGGKTIFSGAVLMNNQIFQRETYEYSSSIWKIVKVMIHLIYKNIECYNFCGLIRSRAYEENRITQFYERVWVLTENCFFIFIVDL